MAENKKSKKYREAMINGVKNLKTLGFSYAEIAKILGLKEVILHPYKKKNDAEEK